ncbi:MAG: tetratricopeptide repeat protein [Bacteroidota bacterium]
MRSLHVIFCLFVISCSFSNLAAQKYYRGHVALEAVKLYKNAKLQDKLGNKQLAKQLYKKALNEDFRYIEAMDKLGDIYRGEGMLDSAVHFYQMSIDREPSGILAYQNLAATYQLKGDYRDAVQTYQDLLSLFPTYTEAYFGLGKLFLDKKDYFSSQFYANLALKDFLSQKQNSRAADARLLAARSYLADRNYKKAVRYLKANKKYTGHKAFHKYYLGLCYMKLGKHVKAEKYLNQAQIMGYQLPVYVKEQIELMGA